MSQQGVGSIAIIGLFLILFLGRFGSMNNRRNKFGEQFSTPLAQSQRFDTWHTENNFNGRINCISFSLVPLLALRLG